MINCSLWSYQPFLGSFGGSKLSYLSWERSWPTAAESRSPLLNSRVFRHTRELIQPVASEASNDRRAQP